MVLLLKHWKSRSSPGIVAGACARDHKNPFTLLLASGAGSHIRGLGYRANMAQRPASLAEAEASVRSEEHTSELQSLMRISYAVFCLKKKKTKKQTAQNLEKHEKHTHDNKNNKTSNVD